MQLDTYELTPRSKVKALLATIDSDSETDGSKSDESYHQKSSSLKRVQNIPTGDLGEPRLSKSTLNKDDESEEEPVRPRGRLVSRLYSHKPTGSNEIHKYRDVQKNVKGKLLRKFLDIPVILMNTHLPLP